MRIAGTLLLAVVLVAWSSSAFAGAPAVVDDFEGVTTEGWAVGASGMQPVVITTGGPTGTNDGFLQATSDGSAASGKMIVFNTTASWTGNWAGRDTIYMHARNLGSTALTIRVLLEGSPGSEAITTSSRSVPVGSGWRLLVFDVRATALTAISGQTPAQIRSNVTKVRIVHNPLANSNAPSITAQLGLDNIGDQVPTPFCGDNVDNGTDLCDGEDLAGQSCTNFGYINAAGLQCNASCDAYVSSGCAAVCGNGSPEPGEICDTGSSSPTCDGNCTAVSCGDAFCNGPAGETAVTCIADCPTTCGDALITGGEMCDGANLAGNDCADFSYVATAGLGCAGNCASFVTTGCSAVCGNTTIEPGETCDAGSQTAGCDGDCTAVTCGDSRCNSAANETAITCAADCATVCGDGLITGAESCDGGNLAGNDCADFGYVMTAGLACAGNCASFVTTACVRVCGNSVAEPGEACDSGGVDGPSCDADCSARVCGDGHCNAAASETPLSCSADCATVCGDALVSGAEVCDGVNLAGQDCADHGYVAVAGLACNGACNAFVTTGCTAACGNSTAEPGEPCDSGGVDSPTCDGDCSTPTCGDARCNSAASETPQSCGVDCSTACGDDLATGLEVCDGTDLGGQDCTDLGFSRPEGLTCSVGCDLVVSTGCAAICGDGEVEPGEACDDDNFFTDDGCASCQVSDGWTCDASEPSVCTEDGVTPDAGPGPDAGEPPPEGSGCCSASSSSSPGGGTALLALLVLLRARSGRRARGCAGSAPPRR